MLLSGTHPAHLTYCTNVHPGEELADVVEHILGPATAVRRALGASEPFGIGLRIAARAAEAMSSDVQVERLRKALTSTNGYVFTFNGFPYGNFHAGRVKETVYLPDWSAPERLTYANTLAHVLAALLPNDIGYGSISTVPGCYRPAATPERRAEISRALLAHVAELWSLRERTGKHIVVALEPEPHCMLETTAESVRFIEELRGHEAVAGLAQACRITPSAAETALVDHLGVCLDACHSAVEFEDPVEAVASLQRAGIRVAKLQLSVAVLAEDASAASLAALARLDEPTYLHQVVTRANGELRRYADVPEALRDVRDGQQSRVHYHVPVYDERFGNLSTTRVHLQALLALQARAPFTEHLEVETYTWGIFRDAPTAKELPILIARELDWAKQRLALADPGEDS